MQPMDEMIAIFDQSTFAKFELSGADAAHSSVPRIASAVAGRMSPPP